MHLLRFVTILDRTLNEIFLLEGYFFLTNFYYKEKKEKKKRKKEGLLYIWASGISYKCV
jgi:hypothetical protein